MKIKMNIPWRRNRLPYYLFKIISKDKKPISHINDNCIYNPLRTSSEITQFKPTYSYNPIRFKSKKHIDEDSDNEVSEILDDDSSLTRDSKIIKLNTTSLRADLILKSTLGVARNKIEKLFYESKIRVNGKKILKKSIPVREDYEIDVIKSVSPKNPDHLYVARIEILSIKAKEDSIEVTARRFKSLLIENYETDPYKPSTADEDK